MAELSVAESEAMVAELEKKLDRLRILYEQYFLGIQKREPQVQQKDVVRIMRLLEQERIRKTSLRFRLRRAVQKYSAYRAYWNRTIRQMEAGTYRRDVARMKRRAPAPVDDTQERAEVATKKAESVKNTPTTSGAHVSEDDMKSIYRRLVKAKKLCGDSTETLRYDAVARSIQRQLPTLEKRYPGSAIGFQVIIKNGRAILRAQKQPQKGPTTNENPG